MLDLGCLDLGVELGGSIDRALAKERHDPADPSSLGGKVEPEWE